SAASSISSIVLCDPKLKRTEFFVRSSLLPYIAVSTWEGSIEPAVHALPLEAAIPSKSKFVSKDSTFVPGKLTLTVDGIIESRYPFTYLLTSLSYFIIKIFYLIATLHLLFASYFSLSTLCVL